MVKSAEHSAANLFYCGLHRLRRQVQAGQGLKTESWQLRLDIVRKQQLAKLPDLAADGVACAMSGRALSKLCAARSLRILHKDVMPYLCKTIAEAILQGKGCVAGVPSCTSATA